MMTSDRVVEILVNEGGYRLLSHPLKVGSLSFDFTHALVAGGKANDLVIVIDIKGDTADDSVIRKVLALTRALDVLQSRRPVTAVLTSGQARPETVQSISRVCRVLPIGAPNGPNAADVVRDWLLVLLPFHQPPAVETFIDWEGDIRRGLPRTATGPMIEALIRVAPGGRDPVENILRESIVAVVEATLVEDQRSD